MSERDTHFAGFAKLLYDDIYRRIEQEYGPMHSFRPKIRQAVKTIIAERAYDLVFHILKNADDLYLDMGGYKDVPSDDTVEENMKHLPDLTSWTQEEGGQS